MTNPIQQVLDAQARAQDEIDTARRAADARLVEARAGATALQQRNGERTRRAIRQAESRCQEKIKREINELEQAAHDLHERFQLIAERNLDDLVTRVVAEIWPRNRP